MKKILITGSAGFIGFHIAKKLCIEGHFIVGLDNLNGYYDVKLKLDRLRELGIASIAIEYGQMLRSDIFPNLKFIKLNLEDKESVSDVFKVEQFDYVCHLAAQAGVRYSLISPHSYIESNLMGFINILEGCRQNNIKHLVYASSSSVYGLNEKNPFSVKDPADHPVSLYAATKKANELMAHSYSHLYNVSTTGLRFFTVYGPWGRPDMSPMLFADAITKGTPLKIFNNGKLRRDFTYIDDIVEGIAKVIFKPARPSETWQANCPTPNESSAPYKIYNIGNSTPIELMAYIETFEKIFGKKAIKEFCPMQPGDVTSTYSDIMELKQDFDYCPSTKLEDGIKTFFDWYVNYYKV